MGISVDHIPCLQAWAESLGGITYPLLSDFWPHGSVAELYGVMRKEDGHSERALFVIDAHGFIRYIDIHPIDDRPDNDVLRQVLRDINNDQDETGLSGVFYEDASTARQMAEKELEKAETVALQPALVDVAETPQEGAPIVIYCARWCKDCRKAKEWFDQRNLRYIEVDIDYDKAARSRVRQWANGFLVTPVIDVCGTVVLDFNIAKIEAALREHGMME